jgi:uncharacterized protein (TIGR02145 family)
MKNYLYAILLIACITACSKNEDKSAQVKTLSATGVTNVEATCWGKITEQGTAGIREYGIEVELPEGTKMLKYTTSKADSFGVQLTGLILGSQYVYRAYAVENNDNIKYGNYKEFITLIPTDFLVYATNITEHSADIQFTNTEQLREWGLYYGSNDPATTSDTKVEANGEQAVTLTGLEPYTVYYILGYATDKNGIEVFSDNGFRTGYALPQLSILTLTDPTVTGTTAGFEITHIGGGTISECGIRYSTNAPDENKWTRQPVPYAEGAITYALTGLNPATKYYVQAYARNTGGREGYSGTVQLTTLGAVPALAKPTVTGLTSYKINMTGGKVTDENLLTVTEYGFCWSTTQGQAVATGNNYAKVTTGSKDAFDYFCFDLPAGTRHYVRAYAKNQAGTGYSEEISVDIPNPQYGELTDTRDSKKYKTVIIGNQEWMAEYLDYDYIWGYVDEGTGIRMYDGLPTWPFSLSDNVAPEGWHIPTYTEIEEMLTEIGKPGQTGYGWRILSSGTNTTGLSLEITPNPRYASGYAWFWSASFYGNYLPLIYGYRIKNSADRESYTYGEDVYLPVRCIKNK